MSLTEDALKYIRSLSGYVPVEPRENDNFPSKVITLPEKSQVVSLEQFQALPNRIKHEALLASSAAFAAYVNRFNGPETSIYLDIFGVDASDPVFAAVLDHHGKDPAWGSHRAAFRPKLSLEWRAWTELHAAGPITQQELLAFFEDHANDLSTPSPAAMLTALSKFERVEKHTYQTAQNLDNGNISVTYTKDGGQTKVEFPHEIALYIPVLENEAPRLLPARIRYRTLEGSVRFTFQFKHDPERVRRDALRGLAESLKEQCAGVHFYEGVFNDPYRRR